MMPGTNVSGMLPPIKWCYLGQGTFNIVGVSSKPFTIGNYSGLWVWKQGRENAWPAKVSVNKWNEINPSLPAYLTDNGWICPYISQEQASDRQTALELLNIYRRSQNIVLDAYVTGNFLRYGEGCICVDVDYAINRRTDKRSRRDIDEDIASNLKEMKFSAQATPKSVRMIKNLLYLEINLHDSQLKDEFLQYNVLRSMNNFRIEEQKITVEHLQMLSKITTLSNFTEIPMKLLTVEHIKRLCALNKTQEILTKEQLFQSFTSLIVERFNPRTLIQNNKLSMLKFLVRQQPELLSITNNDNESLLHLAARYNQMEITQFLISQPLPFTQVTNEQAEYPLMTAIDIALILGSFNIATALSQSGHTISPGIKNNLHYFFYTAYKGMLEEIISCLEAHPHWINFTNRQGLNALMWAAVAGHTNVVTYLISKGAVLAQVSSSKGYSATDWAFCAGRLETYQRLVAAGGRCHARHNTIGNKSIWDLIQVHDVENLLMLIDHNPTLIRKVDQRGLPPLAHAALYSAIDIAAALCSRGAKLTDRIEFDLYGKYTGLIPLEVAIVANKKEFVSYAAGVDFPLTRILNKKRAIFFATTNNLLDFFKKLVEQQPVLVLSENMFQQTPLHLAAARGYIDIVRYILENCPYQSVINMATEKSKWTFYSKSNDKYRTPLDLAIENHHDQVVNLLLSVGAEASFYSGKIRPISVKRHRSLFFTSSMDNTNAASQPGCSTDDILKDPLYPT